MVVKKVLKLVTPLTLALLCACPSSAQDPSGREPVDNRFCTTCHGVDGRGNEGVQAPRLAGMESWYLRRQLQLFKSGARGTHPKDYEGREMQAMAEILSEKGIDEIVEWVGGWPYRPAEPTIDGNSGRGQGLYQPCAACHGKDGQGNEAMNAPALAGQNDWYLLTQLKNFRAGYRGAHPQDTYGAQMRPMAQALPGEKAMIDLISYINELVDHAQN